MKTRFTLRYVVLLLVATMAGFAGLTWALFACGRTAVWVGDEISQYVNYLLYYGRTVRAAVKSLLAGNGFALPFYTLSNGYGMDVYILLGGTFADVFNLPAIVCPGKYVEYCYVGLILVRLLACAFGFSYYCLRRGDSYEASLVGSLCYTFSGALAFQSAIRHPFFLTTAAFFPLIMAGIDKVFESKSPKLFIVSMSLQLLASTYFSYMTCLAMLAYCLVKYFGGTRDRSVADFFLLVGRFVLLLMLAFCIAGVSLAPRVIGLLSQDRLGLTRYEQAWYFLVQYLHMPTDILGGTTNNPALYFGVVGATLLIAFVVARKHFAFREWIVGVFCLACIVIGLVVPYVGKALNGFSYASSRWLYVAAFCCSYLVCRMVPKLKELTVSEWLWILRIVTAVVVLGVVCMYISGVPSGRSILGLLLFFVTATWLCVACLRRSQRFVVAFVSCGIILGLTFTSSIYLLPFVGKQMVSHYAKTGKVYKMFTTNSYAAQMDDVNDDDLYRYSAAKVYGSIRNASLNLGSLGIDFYKSSYNQHVDDFRTELGLSDDSFNIRFFGSDDRLAIEGLTGSKYYVCRKKDAWRVPAGYELATVSQKDYQIWRASSAVPLVFCTSDVISRDAYEALSMAEKQEALLQGCVLDDALAKGAIEPTLSSTNLPCEIVGDGSVRVEDGSLTVLRWGSSVTLNFEGLADCETYIQLLGLDYGQIMPSALLAMREDEEDDEEERLKDKIQAKWDDINTAYPSEYSITASVASGKKPVDLSTSYHPQYGGKHDWLINLGHVEGKQTSVRLTFSHPGVYSFKDLSIVCQPTAPLLDALETLSKNGAKKVTFDGRVLKANIETSQPNQLAVITVPYADGWTAYVDGKKAEVLQADTAFMAVNVGGEGSHIIELRYFNPALIPGILSSVAGVAIAIACAVISRKRGRGARE